MATDNENRCGTLAASNCLLTQLMDGRDRSGLDACAECGKSVGDLYTEHPELSESQTSGDRSDNGATSEFTHLNQSDLAGVHSSGDASTSTVIGNYEILEQLGQGGMGTVYRAEPDH